MNMPAPKASPIRIMLLNDHPIVLWGLEQLIETQGSSMLVVAKTGHADEALGLLATTQPDVVVLSLDLHGEDAVALIEAFSVRSNARVLILTGSHDTTLHDSAILAGASGVILKSDAIETILKAIVKTSQGEIWLNRFATNRIFHELTHRKAPFSQDIEQDKLNCLTPREREIVAVIACDSGNCCKHIAEKLHISEHTLRNHLAAIYEKLGLSNRLQLFAYANMHGLTTTGTASHH
jgi:DNA-binding NarL/FixJ family response regulator